MAVLAVALDAVDRDLAWRWASEGRLPALARLLGEGSSARLASPAAYFPEASWPTITTGCGPGKTGHYSYLCIRPGTYSRVFAPGRSHRRPFWDLLAEEDRRVLLVDVPYADLRHDERIVQLSGWGQRGAMRMESWPFELAQQVVDRYGRYSRWLDHDFDRSTRSARRHLRESLRLADAHTALFRRLLRTQPWELALLVYWEPHNAGHAFHRYVGDPPLLGDALLDVYRRVDRGLGDLLAAVPAGSDVVVFSPYGLCPSGAGRELLTRVLTGLGYQVPRDAPPVGRIARSARARLPWSVRRHVNARLSPETQMRVIEQMFSEAIDWDRTRAAVESEYAHGWIRVNLRGREPRGIVARGTEHEALCDEIDEELRALTDADSGEPLVAEVARSRDLFPGPHLDELPDLLVRWAHKHRIRAARHPKLGVVPEDGRDIPTAEHTGEGFLVAAGPHVRAAAEVDADLVDVAPTLLYLLGAPVPQEMDGRVLEELIEPATLAARPVARAPIPWLDDRWAR